MNTDDPPLEEYGYWDDHPKHPAQDWMYEVQCGYTRQSYWAWVRSELHADQLETYTCEQI